MADGEWPREIVAGFGTKAGLEQAVEDLQSKGIERARLSVLADRTTIEERLGHPLEDTRDAMRGGADLPRREPIDRAELGDAVGATAGIPAYVGAVAAAGIIAASGGTLAGIAFAALLGGVGGGAVGGFLGHRLNRQVQSDLDELMARGGMLLWVIVHSEEERRAALESLRSVGPDLLDELSAA